MLRNRKTLLQMKYTCITFTPFAKKQKTKCFGPNLNHKSAIINYDSRVALTNKLQIIHIYSCVFYNWPGASSYRVVTMPVRPDPKSTTGL